MNTNQQKILELAKKKDISKMSFRAISRDLGIKNPQTVIHHLNQLRKKGLLYFDSEQKKQRVAKPKGFFVDKLFSLPILGFANCGDALELAQENICGYLKISPRLLKASKPDGLFAIKAVGNSLNMASVDGNNIEDGDYLIVDGKRQPKNGDYVLSVIDGAANFKKFYKDDNKKEIRLISESTFNIPPIVLHEDDLDTSGYFVNGVVVKVVKG